MRRRQSSHSRTRAVAQSRCPHLSRAATGRDTVSYVIYVIQPPTTGRGIAPGSPMLQSTSRRRLGGGQQGSWVSAWNVDARALVALRVAVGVLGVLDVVVRLCNNWRAMLTDEGLLSSADLTSGGHVLSVFLVSNIPAVTFLLLLAHAMLAGAVALGFAPTRLLPLYYVALCSLHARNEFVLNGGDKYLRLIVFWLALASHDVALADWHVRHSARRAAPAMLLCSVPLVCVQLQVVILYVVAGLAKYRSFGGGHDWTAGHALASALANPNYATERAHWLGLTLPRAVLSLGTWAVRFSEVSVPLLLASPLANSACRLVFFLWLQALHAAFFVLMHIGLFPLTGMLCGVIVAPPPVWDRLAPLFYSACAPLRHLMPAPAPAPRRSVWAARLCALGAALAMAWVLAHLSRVVHEHAATRLGRALNAVGRDLKLEQQWRLFCAVPLRFYWLTVTATRQVDRAVVDVYRRLHDGVSTPLDAANASAVLVHVGERVLVPPGRWRESLDTALSDRWIKIVDALASGRLPAAGVARAFCAMWHRAEGGGLPRLAELHLAVASASTHDDSGSVIVTHSQRCAAA